MNWAKFLKKPISGRNRFREANKNAKEALDYRDEVHYSKQHNG